PFVGYAGFYFGVLDGQTSSSVPTIDNGVFSPVIELGLALSIGLGKTISMGPLSGGITIAVLGMLKGVFATFQPQDKSQPSVRFNHIEGLLALTGSVYATLDFGIISASVSLTVYASVDLVVESYQPVTIELSAGVSVSVSVKIIFVRITFSFSATITEQFQL